MGLSNFRPDLGKVPYKKDFVFQALDWHAEDTDNIELDIENKHAPKRKYVITIFGVTLEGHTVSADITGYNPHFYVEIPKDWRTDAAAKFVHNLKESFAADRLQRWGNAKSNPVGDSLKKFEIVKRKKLMGFDGNKEHLFIRLSFYNIVGMRAWVRKIQEQHESDMEIFESNIDPLLRFMHILNLKPLGWIKVAGGKFDLPDIHDRLSQAYLVVDHSAISPVDMDRVAPFLIASYDIEADSATGDFPMAKRGSKIRKIMLDIVAAAKTAAKNKGNAAHRKEELAASITSILSSQTASYKAAFEQLRSSSILDDLSLLHLQEANRNVSGLFLNDEEQDTQKPSRNAKAIEDAIFEILNIHLPEVRGDRIIQIGTTFQRFGDPNYSFKHVITLDTCSPIDGTFVQTCKTEKELLLGWKDLIASADPDIITGKQLS